MNAVRDNSTFTRKSSLLYPPNHSDECHYELQRSIHNHIVMNKFWKKFNKRYNKTIIRDKTIPNSNDNANSTTNNGNSNGNDKGNIDPNKAHDGRKRRPKTIDRRLYPALLEKLTGKPQFLFQSLKLESPIIFGGTLTHALLKKRRRKTYSLGNDARSKLFRNGMAY